MAKTHRDAIESVRASVRALGRFGWHICMICAALGQEAIALRWMAPISHLFAALLFKE